ncbi:MAG: hypothetical protein J5972_06940 [Eubacterium sp.]|nr:hypothetical protein [Eubacterium sp.]
MYHDTARLIMYGKGSDDEILRNLSKVIEVIHDENISESKETLVREVYDQVYGILQISTKYGFDNNLWKNYIAYLLATDENPFSILCETRNGRLYQREYDANHRGGYSPALTKRREKLCNVNNVARLAKRGTADTYALIAAGSVN